MTQRTAKIVSTSILVAVIAALGALTTLRLVGGERISNPGIALVGDPDTPGFAQVRSDLEALWLRRRPTVLFITHSVEEAVGLSDRILVMSPSPGMVVDEIKVELPRPRPLVLGDAPEFGAYVNRIHHHFERLGVLHGAAGVPTPQ